MSTGKYDNVMNYFGESVEHYGKKDAPTYFAEECFQAMTLTVKKKFDFKNIICVPSKSCEQVTTT